MTGHTCVFFPRILAIIPATRYTCVLFPSIWPFSYKRAYICAQKTPIYKRYKQACVYGVTESRRIRCTELDRQQKPVHVRWSWKIASAWIKHGRNGRVNFEQGLVLIHCPHSSGGCWLPDNGFVGIRGLSLERLCTLFHECWPKQRSIQLEISVRRAKHDSWARDNIKHDLESLLEQISFSPFLSLAWIITQLLLHEHVLSLQVSKLCILSPHSLYKFHVSCLFSHTLITFQLPLFPCSSTLIVIFMVI